jgi:hypothetical protein
VARITQKPTVAVSATLLLSESELRALDALVGYGVDPFLEVFYAKMGRAYLEPHERGLRELFDSIRSTVPGVLSRADDAREAFEAS